MNPRIRIATSFTKLPDNTLITFARSLLNGLYTMTEQFPNPPISAADFEAAINAFSDAKAAQPQTGRSGTEKKNVLRDALIDALKRLAFYVQENCGNQMVIVLASGFDAVSLNRSRSNLGKPSLLKIINGILGQLLITISREASSKSFEVAWAEVDESGKAGDFRSAMVRTSSRNIPVDGLTPGKMIALKGRGIGGASGFSDWSDIVMFRVG
jgi:hypothetical protein